MFNVIYNDYKQIKISKSLTNIMINIVFFYWLKQTLGNAYEIIIVTYFGKILMVCI